MRQFCCLLAFNLPLPFLLDHETVASVSADLGTCYYNSGKYDFAISTFEDGLRIILLAENDRSIEVAEALYKIASCHDSLCNYDEGKFSTSYLNQLGFAHRILN